MNTVIIYDLEYWSDHGVKARNWDGFGEYRELTEIGAVRIDVRELKIVDTFHRLSRPFFTQLTPYLLDLTHKCRQDFAQAAYAPQVIEEFFEFAGSDSAISYGEDARVILENMVLHDMNGFSMRDDGKWMNTTLDKSAVCIENENGILFALYGEEAAKAHALSRGKYFMALRAF